MDSAEFNLSTLRNSSSCRKFPSPAISTTKSTCVEIIRHIATAVLPEFKADALAPSPADLPLHLPTFRCPAFPCDFPIYPTSRPKIITRNIAHFLPTNGRLPELELSRHRQFHSQSWLGFVLEPSEFPPSPAPLKFRVLPKFHRGSIESTSRQPSFLTSADLHGFPFARAPPIPIGHILTPQPLTLKSDPHFRESD